jgi:antitoxin component of MazEF toxin-antitoxin module
MPLAAPVHGVSCAYMKAHNIREGSPMEGSIRSENPVVAIDDSLLSLEELVARITPENRHDEIGTGRAIGNEVW